MMIKRLFFSVLAMGLLFVSCESNDDENPPEDSDPTAELLGVWNYIAYVDNEGEEPATDCEKNQTIDFQENDVFQFTYYDDYSGTCEETQNATGNWSYVSEGVIELDYGSNDVYQVSYTIVDNTLTLTIDEGEGEYQEVYQK